MTGEPGESSPKFADVLDSKDLCQNSYADRMNKRLKSLGCAEVHDGEEAIIASATFKEQDGALASGMVPTITAAVGAILATYGDEFSLLILAVTAVAAIITALLQFSINQEQRTQAVATRIIEYRLDRDFNLQTGRSPS